MGVYTAFNRETNFLDFHLIAFELFRTITSFMNEFPSNYYAHAIYHYYTSNQTLTNNTIFIKNNLLTAQQSNLIWNDIVFGWNK